MTDPIVNANESLVVNGEFRNATTGWTTKGFYAVGGDLYENKWVSLLILQDAGSIWQEIIVPKGPDDNAQYILSFLCEVDHPRSGWMRIFNGDVELSAIELTPDPQRKNEHATAGLGAGQPLVFLPKAYNMQLDKGFKRDDVLRLEIVCPRNDHGDYFSRIRITRINLQLHLQPLKLQSVQLDEESFAPGGTLHLCLGAVPLDNHRFTIIPETGNAWLDTAAALFLEGNPGETVTADPPLGEDNDLGSQWKLICPLVGDEGPFDINLKVVNRYNAEPYTIPVSLGHHRVVFRDPLEAAYYPVLEYKQTVRLGVQVASFYTGQALGGRTVTWSVAAQGVNVDVVSDEHGWADFTYDPTADGDFFVTASVSSPYYAEGVATHTFGVKVLATDPWRELLAIVDGAPTEWGATGYPNRGSEYGLLVRLPAGSPLLGSQFSLRWKGDHHEQLDVVISPELDTPVPVNSDTAWTLDSGDRQDGKFDLSLVCSKLLLPSPSKPMSLARNRLRIEEVREANKFPIVDENESVLLRVRVVHDITAGNGDPVGNALVEWKTPEGDFSDVTGPYGWTSLHYTPTSAGDHTVTVNIKAYPEAQASTWSFPVQAIATSPWKNQVSIWLDDELVERNTLGVLCRRGQTHTLRVEPVEGSPWTGKNISLHWRGAIDPDIGLMPAGLGVQFPLLAEGVQWELQSLAETSLSSLFELELRLENVGTVRELSGRLVSVDLKQEMRLLLDQVLTPLDEQVLYPCLGARHRFNVSPNALSPLVGLQVSLAWSGKSAEDLQATVQPDLGAVQVLSDSGVVWILDFSASEQPGRFELTVALPQLNFIATAKPMDLGHNKVRFEATLEDAVDPVVGQAPVWLAARVYSHFTERPVSQVPVRWFAGEGKDEPTDENGWSRHAVAPKSAGDVVVIASLRNNYDGYEDVRTFSVKALGSDPWRHLTVSFDDQPAQPLGAKTWFARRSGKHKIHVHAPQSSPLFGKYLTLGMARNGPTPLGISFDPPALGVRNFLGENGLVIDFRVADVQNGSTSVLFAADRLASLSPENAMSVGPASQVMKIADHQRTRQTLLWGEHFFGKVKVISVISGKPMSGVTVTFSTSELGEKKAVTNAYGVAKLDFAPTRATSFVVTATVGDDLHSESVAWDCTLMEPVRILELYEPTFSRQPPDTSRAHAHALVVSASTQEPLPGVKVQWKYETLDLVATETDPNGIASLIFSYSEETHGILTATVKGGIAGWEVAALAYGGEIPEVMEITASSRLVLLGSAAIVSARVERAPEGAQVRWRYPDADDAQTPIGADGWARHTFTPRTFPAGGFGVVQAEVTVTDVPVSASMTTRIWVTDTNNAVIKGAALFINKVIVLFPAQVVVPVRLNKVVDVGLTFAEELTGRQFSIACSRDDIAFEPSAGKLITVGANFTWRMSVTASIGDEFAIAMTSPDFAGSIGVRFAVIASDAADDELLATDQTDDQMPPDLFQLK
ncbi:hypothetical protein ATI02_0300 [Pseudomonas baetica]|uniref:Ig-like domain-containing protein n=1 Tax=Pseudomonas baetica TaxID=674054 RepID=A0ABX4PRF2_9PSED|nr:hypothetical protein [Pseudomonas baetica]PKA67599.1 hypothetical protein ATI02_0300 [Pseudomonas baetica]PTC18493.1 hypothetical protein C0J26_21130 [Pseudomonas baetica]